MGARRGRTWSTAAVLVLVGAMVVALGRRARRAQAPPIRVPHPRLVGEPVVWAVDDTLIVDGASGRWPAMRGEGNPVWRPGEPVRLFALPGETVAFQVVVSAGDEPLEAVEVRLGAWVDEEGRSAEVRTEGFVVHDLPMRRRSAGADEAASLGWARGAAPPGPPPGGALADVLIPLELAPAWAPHPLRVGAGRHGVVWFDVTLASDAARGVYTTVAEVRDDDTALAELDVEITVGSTELPFRGAKTMLFFEPEDVAERCGSDAAVRQLQQLMQRHHVSMVFPIRDAGDIQTHRDALDGSLFTKRRGYRGAGEGVGADVVVLGAYGVLGAPTADALAKVEMMLEALRGLGIEDRPGERDVFLYAVDEQCDSSLGSDWRAALDAHGLSSLRVGHTCSEPPDEQAVDLVMMFAGGYQPELAERGVNAGKRVWIYNGELPRTGTYLTDGLPISLRANAWIQSHHGIERWFYWESTFWNDDNRGGQGPYDPLARAETFHNADGDHANGDGVLVYPGTQRGGFSNLDFDGVVPSIRLKAWRRGIQDAAYIRLARAVDAAATRAIVAPLVGSAFEARVAPRFPVEGAPWVSARRQLFDIITAK